LRIVVLTQASKYSPNTLLHIHSFLYILRQRPVEETPKIQCGFLLKVEVNRPINFQATRKYPYFDVVAGLEWSYDPESYASGSVAAGRVSHAGQVKGDAPDKKGYRGPPDWGGAWG
jgi:hypothetical protein